MNTRIVLAILVLTGLAAGLITVGAAEKPEVPPTANGIDLPADYRDWRVIGVSQRTDNNSLRVILGNDAAIAAVRRGETNPWPDGAVIGKVVWKNATNALWEKVVVPGELVHAEFMVKDRAKYAATGGWGYARWKGTAQVPHGTDAVSAAAECAACHAGAKRQDYVFTQSAVWP